MTTTINAAWIQANQRSEESYTCAYINYLQTTNGAKTVLEASQKQINLIASISPSLTVSKFPGSCDFSPFISALSLMLVPAALQEAWESLTAAQGDNWGRKSITAIRETSDAIAMGCSALSLFSSNPTMEAVASVAENAYDGSDLYLSSSGYVQAQSLEELSTGEVKDVFTHSKNYYLLRTLRAVTSIAAAVFSLFLIAFSPHWIWGVVALTLSFTASMMSIQRDAYKESGKYPIVSFDHPVLV